MKPVIPIIIVVGVAVAIILVMLVSQQSQINELQRNDDFDDALNNCSQFIYDTEEKMKNCISNSFDEFGTLEEKERLNDHLKEIDSYEKTHEKTQQLLKDLCREQWIGQLEEYNECMRDVEYFD